MIKYPKTILKKPAVYDMIRDVGSYITHGNLVLTKALSVVGFDRIATPFYGTNYTASVIPQSYSVPYELAGNNVCNASVISYVGNNSGGSGASINNGSGSAIKPSSWQTFMVDTYTPYFNSTSGPTLGKSLMCYPGSWIVQANSDGTQSLWSTSRVAWDGTCTTINYGWRYTTSFGNSIIGENATTLFVLCQWLGNGQGGNSTDLPSYAIYAVNKTTTVGTLLNSTTQTLIYKGNTAPKILVPLTADNKCVIVNYPTGGQAYSQTTQSYGGQLTYWILDFNAGTVNNPTTQLLTSVSTAVNTCIVPSSTSNELLDSTKYKYYIPSCDPTATNATTIKRLFLPKTIGTTYATGSPLAGDMTSCTLSSLPTGVTIPNPNNNPTSTYSMATSSCIYLNQISVNTKEYVIVLNMGFTNMVDMGVGYSQLQTNITISGGNFGTMVNGCDVSRQCLFVFQIDPTNSANLIYKSAINDGTGFGTNSTLYNINKSADSTLIVLSNAYSFVVLTWNSTSESYNYSKPFAIPNGIGRISLDTQNRIWIQEFNSDSIYVFSLNNSMNVVVNFTGSPNSLNYSGTNLTQNVTVNAYDLTSTRYAKTVNLQVVGNATFSNGTNTINVTTSTSADTLTALTITGPGNVQVIPTLVV